MRIDHRPRAAALLGLAALSSLAISTLARADDLPRRYPPDRPFDVSHEALDLDVDLAGRAVSGTATLTIVGGTTTVTAIDLDAVDLEIGHARARSSGPSQDLAFYTNGATLSITLAQPLEPRHQAVIEIDYVCRHTKHGLHFFGPTPEEPTIPLQVWTQGESVDGRHWFPCVDTPEMRSTSDMIVHAPKGFEVISNGACTEQKGEAGGKTRWVFVEKVAHPAYLTSLVVGKFAKAVDTWRGKPVEYYVPESRKADIARSFSDTPKMLDYFSDRFGVEYPYEKYSQVCVEQFVVSGMENMSCTTLTDRTLHDEREHLDLDEDSDSLVSHELAHQWWGDLLTCRDWAHIWLNEGFASYFEACWDENRNGPDGYDYNMLQKAGGAIGGGRDLPIVRRRYDKADDTFGGGTYPKGAWVLHMLRRQLGDELFWKGLQAYIHEHRNQAVETEDFRESMERATGRSLGDFFYEWTERAGAPVFDVTIGWDEKDKLLSVRCKQTQAGEPFAVSLDLEIMQAADAGAKTVRLPIEKADERMFIPLAARPRWVRFDAREEVLKELTLHEDREMLIDMLEHAKRPIERIEAVRGFGKDKSNEVVDALGKRLLAEPFWGAAVEIARKLGDIPGDRARDALLAALDHAHPKVRRAVIEGLGHDRRDKKVADALLAHAQKGEPSVRAEAAVGHALAKLHDARAFDVLTKMLGEDSSNELLRTSALRGLADLPDLRGLPLARERLKIGEKRRIREVALETAGKLAARKECDEATRKAVVDDIAKCLEDDNSDIRQIAAGALRDIGAGAESSIAALEVLASHDPEDDVQSSARDAVAKIRAGVPADAEIARLRDELKAAADAADELKERIEKLEAKK